jgi:hypothetical protein
VTFCNKFVFYGKGLLAPRPTPKLKDDPLPFVRGCLFNIFTANLQDVKGQITKMNILGIPYRYTQIASQTCMWTFKQYLKTTATASHAQNT